MFFLQIFFVRVFKISAHILIQDVIVVRVSERFIYSGRCGVSFCTFIRTQTTHKIGPVYIFLNSINPLFFPHRKLLCERVNVLPLNFFFLCHSFSEPDATHFFSTFIARQSNWIAVALIYQDLHKWMYIQIWYILNIDHHFHYGEEMTVQRSTILSFGALTKYKPKTNVNVV